MPTTSNSTKKETRFVRTVGSGGPEGARHLTIGDLEDFIAAAKLGGIPADTIIEGPSMLFAAPMTFVQATHEVVVEEATA